MFARKLEALSYHSYNNFDINNEKQLRSLVLWLEDQQIRHYTIEDREGLRDIDSPKWPEAFNKYCDDVNMTISSNNRAESLEWLIGYAVRLAYQDNIDKYQDRLSENVKNSKTEAPRVTSTNPLDNLDFDCDEFKKGVKNLADILKVTSHPDHLVTLKAISSVVTQAIDQNPVKDNNKATTYPIMEADLGFELGDYVLNQAAKIMRLLYIHDLRHLQTSINECIVAVQNITADPKTDTKLGKVGF